MDLYLSLPQLSVADTLEVCETGNSFKTMVAALAQAQPGDIVWVRAGTYREREPVRLPVGVALRGEDTQRPEWTVVWSGEGHAVIGTGRVLTATCALEGFAITGDRGRAIYIQDGARQLVRHNVIRRCVNGYKGQPSAAIMRASLLPSTTTLSCTTPQQRRAGRST